MSHSGLLSRRYTPPASEADAQVHAILRPILQEAGAALRRQELRLQLTDDPNLSEFELLDELLDLLYARMRVDPRPRPTTRNHPRPQGIAPPPVPTNEAQKAAVAPPPPLPFANLTAVEPPQLPSLGAPPADEQDAPPLPPTSQHQRPTVQKRAGTLPIQPPTVVQGPLIAPYMGENSFATRLLLDDAQTLSLLMDRDGMLISFERLLVLSRIEGQLREVIEKNEPRILSFHEAELKSFKRVPKFKAPMVENTMPRAYLRAEKIAIIIGLIDGVRDIETIVRTSELYTLEATSVLCQLKRSGVIDV